MYPEYAGDADRKYLTWKTVREDIAEQRKAGKKGIRFKITLKLVNRNRGKYKTVERVWNKKFERYVPREWGISDFCEIRECRVPVKPEWEYHILGVVRL